MYKQINESEFIKMFDWQAYETLVSNCYTAIQDKEEFKNSKPYFYSLMQFDCFRDDGTKIYLIVECDAHKLANSRVRAYDFGIRNLFISNEEMPDELLDRYNEIKKAKEKIRK